MNWLRPLWTSIPNLLVNVEFALTMIVGSGSIIRILLSDFGSEGAVKLVPKFSFVSANLWVLGVST